MDSVSYWSLDWLTPSTFRAFTWSNVYFLYAIALVPILLLIRWLWRYFFNQKLPVAFTKSDLKTSPLRRYSYATPWKFLPPPLVMMRT